MRRVQGTRKGRKKERKYINKQNTTQHKTKHTDTLRHNETQNQRPNKTRRLVGKDGKLTRDYSKQASKANKMNKQTKKRRTETPHKIEHNSFEHNWTPDILFRHKRTGTEAHKDRNSRQTNRPTDPLTH